MRAIYNEAGRALLSEGIDSPESYDIDEPAWSYEVRQWSDRTESYEHVSSHADMDEAILAVRAIRRNAERDPGPEAFEIVDVPPPGPAKCGPQETVVGAFDRLKSEISAERRSA